MKIVQVSEALSFGDAISNDVVAIDKLLKENELSGGIFVTNRNNIDKRYLNNIAKTIDDFPVMNKEDILLLHHAIANDFCYALPKLKCKKVLVYHNITPPSFFDGISDGLRNATAKGLVQAKFMSNKVDCCIADSEFNKNNLEEMGYKCPIYVCPVLIPFDDYEADPNPEIVNEFQDDWVNILFVGRLSPNKKQEDIIRTYAIYKKHYNEKARLFLVGNDSMDIYADSLREYARKLQLDDVYITGSVPFQNLIAYYRIADVFLCMSEHEGFCVPIVEAMYFNVPVVAYKSSAVPGTIGDSGILLKEKDFLLTAAVINEVSTNEILSNWIIERQQDKIKDYYYNNVATKIVGILKSISREEDQEEKGNTSPNNEFDALIVIKASDWPIAKKSLPFIKTNINPKRIVIVSSTELLKELPNDDKCVFIDENKILDGMNINSIRRILKESGGDGKFAGWYLQQFIKLYYSFITEGKYYLVWDADTIPIKKIDFFDKVTNKPFFNMKREYVEPYFVTIKNLFGYGKSCQESFITEHMMFDAMLCRDLIYGIEAAVHIKGDTFYEKCIYASEFGQWNQTFSEYETFGTYVIRNYPDKYEKRRLRTFRLGMKFLGEKPSIEMLQWAGKSFDTISFEHWEIPKNACVRLCSSKTVRRIFSFAQVVRLYAFYAKSKRSLGDLIRKKEWVQSYERFEKEMEFDWFFGEQPVFNGEIDSHNKIDYQGLDCTLNQVR